ncbi:ABC transporter permease [Limisalsivibrio acetivorans]|uniref:ABC transporter permease n=1 Tax=Limisalsivibrio acetivorans TaxID=1304888 RepID=UPI0003B5C520|nr:ABC transporter permease [Limisalsivibrio acetivorans]
MHRNRIIAITLFAAALIAFASFPEILRGFFRAVEQESETIIYNRTPLIKLLWQHIYLVGISSALSVVAGVSAGIFVTRPFGRDYLPMVNTLVSLGQTFPPVAVLAVAVPFVGFGAKPTLIALFIYGLFPIVRNTIAGINAIEPAHLDAAKGMGMNGMQRLFMVELPISAGVIMAGVRTSVIINTGTAAIGATIGAGGLGAPIVSGLISDNFAFVIQGSVCVSLLAIILDRLMLTFEERF